MSTKVLCGVQCPNHNMPGKTCELEAGHRGAHSCSGGFAAINKTPAWMQHYLQIRYWPVTNRTSWRNWREFWRDKKGSENGRRNR